MFGYTFACMVCCEICSASSCARICVKTASETVMLESLLKQMMGVKKEKINYRRLITKPALSALSIGRVAV